MQFDAPVTDDEGSASLGELTGRRGPGLEFRLNLEAQRTQGDDPTVVVRRCDQCGTAFEPRREHDRFCCAGCRIGWNWNHQNPCGSTHSSALAWSVVALRDTVQQLAGLTVTEPPEAYAVIGEAVWRVTIVDATMIRYHPGVYQQTVSGQPLRQRQVTERTLAGLRFVRNQMGYRYPPSAFVQPAEIAGLSAGSLVAEWIWKAPPSPPPGRQGWEMDRYQAYLTQLAGHVTGEAFRQTSAFLLQVSAKVG